MSKRILDVVESFYLRLWKVIDANIIIIIIIIIMLTSVQTNVAKGCIAVLSNPSPRR